MHRPLTAEERRHPDVRLVYPHLCGLKDRDYDALVYPTDTIVTAFETTYGTAPFFETRTVKIPGWVYESSARWCYTDQIKYIDEAVTAGNQPPICGHGLFSYAGVRDTIHNLTSASTVRDRMLAFIYATHTHGGERSTGPYRNSDKSPIVFEAIWQRLHFSLWRGIQDAEKLCRYNHNTKYTAPWHADFDDELLPMCENAQTLSDVMAIFATIARRAQEQGQLVVYCAAPANNATIQTDKTEAGEALARATRLFQLGKFTEATSNAQLASQRLSDLATRIRIRKNVPS